MDANCDHSPSIAPLGRVGDPKTDGASPTKSASGLRFTFPRSVSRAALPKVAGEPGGWVARRPDSPRGVLQEGAPRGVRGPPR